MKLRLLLLVALAFTLCSCKTTEEKEKEKKAAAAVGSKQDMSKDTSFQAFIGRLNRAAQMRDVQMLSTLMTPNFGYRLEPPGEGNGVFQYWDENNVWPELQRILGMRFAPKDNFMVAPVEFVTDQQYNGYRAGVTIVNGSWKFAYFVKD